MSGVKGEGLVEGVENALSLFVREQTSEGEAGVIINGDVQASTPAPGLR